MIETIEFAQTIQCNAAEEGFGWTDLNQALDKVQEELDELRSVAQDMNSADFREEYGDLLFACVGIAVVSNHSSAKLLDEANNKFSERYTTMQETMARNGIIFASSSLAEKIQYWNECKTVKILHCKDG